MGSSKKHKSDREHKHKHRHRSRSRSRSRDRHQNKKRREKDEEKKPKQHVSSRVETDVILEKNEPTSEVASVSGDTSSLSIEETNKLRLKLGLKPLDVGSNNAGGSSAAPATEEDGEEAPNKKEDVHVPAINIGEIKKTAKLREKMETQRQKRKTAQKLSKIKTLGESDDDDDDISKWLDKSRRLEKERELAEKTAKMLDQMDQDFGIGNLVEEEFSKDKKNNEYSSRDLKGIKVEHDLESFKEGRSVILTLKDQSILDETAGEVLINVNLEEEEKAAKIQEAKKKKMKDDYQPYDDDEFTEEGFMEPKTILSKYDEEIIGKKTKSFELGASGKYIPSAERELARMRSELKQQEQMLNQTSVRAKEFYTVEEMEETKFKKVKKIKRKIRKKTILKADDLLPLSNDVTSEDLGSRYQQVKESNHSQNGDLVVTKTEPEDNTEEMEIDPPQFEESKILGRFDGDGDDDFDYSGTMLEEDEAMNELHATLDKVRKLKQKKLVAVTDAIEETLNHAKSQIDSPSVVNIKGSDIVLNSTSEFCRALGDIPTYGLAGNRDEERSAFLDLELELMERKKKIQDEEDMSSQWNEVDIDTKPVNIVKEENSVLDEEPAINMGLSAALQVAMKKGYLDNKAKRQPSGPKHSGLEAIHYSIEDKRYDDLDEKYRKRDRYTGMLIDFKEKEGYKPDVRLEYADDSGRLLNEKEAFRQLSHRFHGKGPGKKKTEKRMKKLEEEQLMKQMSSTDTPLNTLTLLQEKQKQERTPYVILSGNKGMSANTIVK